MELTKKRLKELGVSLNAYYMGGNVYDYENIVHYLDYKMDVQSLKKEIGHGRDLSQLLQDLDTHYNLDNFINGVYKISATQLAYSHGVYGNNGQIHQLKIYNTETNEHIFSYYVYYC